jgi:hypothetical protein
MKEMDAFEPEELPYWYWLLVHKRII